MKQFYACKLFRDVLYTEKVTSQEAAKFSFNKTLSGICC